MASSLADLLFAACAAAIVIAQALILVSTARGIREARGRALGARPAVEWAYAIVPAVGLAALLLFAWRAMHPETLRVEGVSPRTERIS